MRVRVMGAVLAGLLVAGALPASAALYQVQYNGITNYTTQPVSVNGTTMVPLRQTLADLGIGNVSYSGSQASFIANGQQVVIDMSGPTPTATVGGQPVALSGQAQVLNGEVWVPATFLSQLVPGYSVTQVLGYRSAPEVTSPTPVPQPYGPSTFMVNGQSFTYQAPTWYMGGVLMVPLNETLTAAGIQAPSYRPGDMQESLVLGNNIVRINAMSGYVHVGNPPAYTMERPAVERGGILYVPASLFLRFLPGYCVSAPATAPPAEVLPGK